MYTENWFPGHMKLAINKINEKISQVDLVINLIDARLPISSKNNIIDFKNKDVLNIFTKKDLTNKDIVSKYLNKNDLLVDLNNKNDFKKVINVLKEFQNQKKNKNQSKGLIYKRLKILIIGFPNTGKSTLINKIAGKKVAKVADKPGQTKSQQWININNDFDLLDTPGILIPKFEDKITFWKNGLINTIKQDILDTESIYCFLIKILIIRKNKYFLNKFKIEIKKLNNYEYINKKISSFYGKNINDLIYQKQLIQDYQKNKFSDLDLESITNKEIQDTKLY